MHALSFLHVIVLIMILLEASITCYVTNRFVKSMSMYTILYSIGAHNALCGAPVNKTNYNLCSCNIHSHMEMLLCLCLSWCRTAVGTRFCSRKSEHWEQRWWSWESFGDFANSTFVNPIKKVRFMKLCPSAGVFLIDWWCHILSFSSLSWGLVRTKFIA